jgi:hypothetical protein
VDALNAVAGAGTYAYVAGPFKDGNGPDAVTAGDDAIMVGMLYKPGKVTPLGGAAVPDVDNPAFNAFTAALGSRVPLAQTFRANADNEEFTVVVNHFKSKGSVNDPDIGDGQGANNLARMEAARDLLAWLGTNPTGNADQDVLLIGDFNAYAKEDPIAFIDANGFNKVSDGASFSFDGLWGSLDHIFASDSLTGQVTGSVKWAINAQEPTVLDYNTENKNADQDRDLFAADAFRSSDHNPILVGLNLGAATPAPAPAPAPQPQPAPVPVTGSVPPAAQENGVPGLAVGGALGVAGDGNGDSRQDSQQAEVVSAALVRANNPGSAPVFVTLVADAVNGKVGTGAGVQITSFAQQNAPAGLPAGLQMPLGVISFTSVVGQVGVSETFSLYVDPGLGINGFWQQDRAGTWINLASQAFGGQTVVEGNKLRLDFQIADGGVFDADGRADGIVTDSGALASMQLSLVGYRPDLAAGGSIFF